MQLFVCLLVCLLVCVVPFVYASLCVLVWIATGRLVRYGCLVRPVEKRQSERERKQDNQGSGYAENSTVLREYLERLPRRSHLNSSEPQPRFAGKRVRCPGQ